MARKKVKIEKIKEEEIPVEIREELKILSIENTTKNTTEIPVVESVLPIVNATEPKVEVKIVTAKLDCFMNDEPSGQFLTKDREYIIINGNDKAFTILNDKGEHHLFLYEDAKDKFNF